MERSIKLLICSKRIVDVCRYYSSKKPKLLDHPYSNIHPWKSEKDFSKFLLNNIIYSHDGLVAINKPYGIPLFKQEGPNIKSKNTIVNAVKYSINDSLEYLAKELDYTKLDIIKAPEKFMSGVTLLSASDKVTKRLKKCLASGKYSKSIPTTYWIVTTKLPREISGKMNLALTLQTHSLDPKEKAPTILTKWSKNAVKDGRVIPFYVEFKLLSNSTDNLASLIEVKSSKRKWHAIRQLAAHILHSPILGDNICGYLIQKVMEAYINVGPFSELKAQMPKLNPQLLKVLEVERGFQEIIPVHIHLRSINLFKYSNKSDLILQAPLMPEFQWTCDRLNFKYITQQEESKTSDDELMLHDSLQRMGDQM